jgi:anti-sigma factor RsiW
MNREVEAHVGTCCLCAAELAEIRKLSGLIHTTAQARATADLPQRDELRRIHRAIGRTATAANDRPLLRIAGVFSAVAASVLIISSAWLMELPGNASVSPGRSHPMIARTAFPEPWEQVALGGYVPPTYLQQDRGYQPLEPALAYNDRELANDIFQSLSR